MSNADETTQTSPSFAWNDIYSGTAADCREPDRLVVETIAGLPVGRALDVGCGAGGLLLALAQKGWKVSGVDLAGNAVRAADAVLKQHGLSAELHVADAARWKPTQRYDLVTSCFALPDDRARQQQTLVMMKRALAPGGTLVVKDFDQSMSRFPHFAGFHMPTVDELVAGLDGLEIIRADVVDTPAHDHGAPGQTREPWTAALVVARR